MNYEDRKVCHLKPALTRPLAIAAALAFCVLLMPLPASAKPLAGMDKPDLVTKEDFLEYASIRDVNIHELYFSTILYEGTESCLMCHQEEAEAVLDTGHFK